MNRALGHALVRSQGKPLKFVSNTWESVNRSRPVLPSQACVPAGGAIAQGTGGLVHSEARPGSDTRPTPPDCKAQASWGKWEDRDCGLVIPRRQELTRTQDSRTTMGAGSSRTISPGQPSIGRAFGGTPWRIWIGTHTHTHCIEN